MPVAGGEEKGTRRRSYNLGGVTEQLISHPLGVQAVPHPLGVCTVSHSCLGVIALAKAPAA